MIDIRPGSARKTAPSARTPPRRTVRGLLPVGALALVAGLDGVARSRHWSVPVAGLLDEPAHLATAWLFLTAFLPMRARAVWPWALVGAVAIDVDHVPLYLWGALAVEPGGRPVTHSLATVVLLLLSGAATSSRLRVPLLGLATGVLLHFVRDLGTGPGVPLLWPVESISIRVPYVAYLGALGVVTVLASVRRVRRSGRSGP